MKSTCHIALLLVASLTLHPPGASAQYDVPYGTVAGGGGMRTGSHIVYDTAGQGAVSGVLAGGSYRVKTGFWYLAEISSTVDVAFNAFSGRYADDVVTLSWKVGASSPFDGFHVYRAEGEQGEYLRLTDAPLDPAATSFTDATAMPGRLYRYKIGAVETGGETFSLELSVALPPKPLTLYQNYPNPFNPSTTIAFFMPRDAHVRLAIYDVSGRLIRTLMNGPMEAGRRSIDWNGRNDRGAGVGSGVYYYRLETGKKVLTRNLVLMR